MTRGHKHTKDGYTSWPYVTLKNVRKTMKSILFGLQSTKLVPPMVCEVRAGLWDYTWTSVFSGNRTKLWAFVFASLQMDECINNTVRCIQFKLSSRAIPHTTRRVLIQTTTPIFVPSTTSSLRIDRTRMIDALEGWSWEPPCSTLDKVTEGLLPPCFKHSGLHPRHMSCFVAKRVFGFWWFKGTPITRRRLSRVQGTTVVWCCRLWKIAGCEVRSFTRVYVSVWRSYTSRRNRTTLWQKYSR